MLASLLALTLLLVPLLTSAVPLTVPRSDSNTRRRAPIKRSSNPQARAVSSNAYIVMFKNTSSINSGNRGDWLNGIMSTAGVAMAKGESDSLRMKWNESVLNGIAGTFSDSALDVIRSQEDVDFVEPDYIMKISEVVQQNNAPWGISRVSTGSVSLAGLDPLSLDFPYFADDSAGSGTDVYVLDTGVLTTHDEFEGRATFLATFGPGVPGQDVNGHGTHVSGTAAGKTVGIAKNANIKMIKVVADDGSAATSDIISGIDLALQTAARTPDRPAVVNMSLGGPASRALDQAVANAVSQGLPFVVAAGNEAEDASTSSPARLAQVITVGATDIDDNIASFSNFGEAVDVFAPGDTIISASFQGDNFGAVLSGTSMASPHIAGLSALIMGQGGKLSPAELSATIKSLAVNGIIRGVPADTDNILAFNGATDATTAKEAVDALADNAGNNGNANGGNGGNGRGRNNRNGNNN